MSKIAVCFLQPHGPFNAGEIAGLEDGAATALIAKGVAKKHFEQPKSEVVTLALNVDFKNLPEYTEAVAAIEKAGADLDARETAISERETVLDAREAAVAEREAALPGTADGGQETVDPVSGEVTAADADTGLPKQGTKQGK